MEEQAIAVREERAEIVEYGVIKRALAVSHDNSVALNRQVDALKKDVAELKKEFEYARQKMIFPEHSEETRDLAKSVSKAKVQGLKELIASGKGQHGDYENWPDLRRAFAEPLDDNGLTVDFFLQERWGRFVFIARMEHPESGQWKECMIEFEEDKDLSGKIKNPDQALGGKMTYRKRQSFSLLLGI